MSIIENYKNIKNATKSENVLNCVVYFIYRPLGFLFAAIIINSKIKPNQITIFKYFVALISLYLIFVSKFDDLIFIIGYFLYFFSDVLDYVDGSLARAKNQTSKFGRIIDTVSDHFFSSIFFFLIVMKTESEFLVYFLILFLTISWSQVYVNTLIRFYKKDINNKINYNNLNNYVGTFKNTNFIKKIFKKIMFIISLISMNLSLITLFIFIYFNLLDEYLYFFFICNIILITLNLILILKNNFTFLNSEDYE